MANPPSIYGDSLGKTKKNIKADRIIAINAGTKYSFIPSNKFHDMLATPFYNNTDEGQVHSKLLPLVF